METYTHTLEYGNERTSFSVKTEAAYRYVVKKYYCENIKANLLTVKDSILSVFSDKSNAEAYIVGRVTVMRQNGWVDIDKSVKEIVKTIQAKPIDYNFVETRSIKL